MSTFKEHIAAQRNSIKQKINHSSQVLIELFSINRLNETLKAYGNSEKFWLAAQSPLYGWLKQHGIDIKVGLPPFSQGGAGRAYFLGQHVVKMTANRVEANVAKMIANHKEITSPIIDVLYLSDNIYAILQHMVNFDIPSEIKSASDFLTALVDDYNFEEFPTDPDIQKQTCIEILKNNKGDISLLPYMLMILNALIYLYKITGFKHDDFGPTNIGTLKGDIVFPDLGPNKNDNPLSTLAKIQKNRKQLGLPRWKSI